MLLNHLKYYILNILMGCTDEKNISGKPQKKINRNMSNINNNENESNKKEIND